MAKDTVSEGTVGATVTFTSLTHDMNQILLDNPPEGLTKIDRVAVGAVDSDHF